MLDFCKKRKKTKGILYYTLHDSECHKPSKITSDEVLEIGLVLLNILSGVSVTWVFLLINSEQSWLVRYELQNEKKIFDSV